MPEGSLGRAYLDFIRGGGLTADFLVQTSGEVATGARADDVDYIRCRMRDAHDLWHVVTGYRGDLLGEVAVLSFTFAQIFNVGIGLLVGVGFAKAGEPDARRLFVDAFARGARAAWLPAIPWEQLLAEDLGAIRLRLRVGPPPTYEPFYARDLPPGGLFARRAA